MVDGYKKIINSYFQENPFGSANLRSFNNFMDKGMQKLVDEIGDIIPTIIPQEVESFIIRLKKIWIEKPSIIEADGSKREITPAETRLRNLTYSAPIFMEISAHINDIEREQFTTQIGNLPIMLKSNFCHLNKFSRDDLVKHGEDPDDPGGYFIINGTEAGMLENPNDELKICTDAVL